MSNFLRILGIARNFPNSTIPDGACREIIDIRPRNNAWRPVGKKAVKFSNIITFDEYHIHTVDEDKIFIGYDKASGYVRYAVNAFPSLISDGLNIGTFDNVKFLSTGNVLSVDVWNDGFANLNSFYALYKRNTQKYAGPINLDFSPIKLDFYSSVVDTYPTPAGIVKYWKHIINGETVFFGYTKNDTTFNFTAWQYSVDSTRTATIINQNTFATIYSIGSFDVYYDGRDDYRDHLLIRYATASSLQVYVDAFYAWNAATKAFTSVTSWEKTYMQKFQANYTLGSLQFKAEGSTTERNAAFAGAYNKAMSAAKEIGQFEGFVMICYAYKLFDGTYIKHSAPALLYVGNSNPEITLNGSTHTLAPFEPGNILYDIQASEVSLIEKIKACKELITSLDVFITKPLPLIDTDSLYKDKEVLNTTHPYFKYSYKSVIEQAVFYKIHSIPVDKISEVHGMSTQTNQFTGVSVFSMLSGFDYSNMIKDEYKEDVNNLSSLVSNQTLNIDNFTHHVKVGRETWTYNKRVMKANTVTRLFKGFGLDHFIGYRATAGNYKLVLEVELNTEDGLNTVRSDTYFTNSTILTLPEVVSYPDSRAKLMRILVYDSANRLKVLKELPLIEHPFLNVAYFINPTMNSQLLKTDIGAVTPINKLLFTLVIETAPFSGSALNDLVYNTNEVHISEVNNPVLYPAKNSHQVGEGDILKLASNTLPISEGQYGQHPIFVGTTRGWWAMNILGGEVFVGTITPLNGTVCTNGNSVAYVDDTVVFASKEGLMILQGTHSVNISLPLCDQPVTPLSGNDKYQVFVNNPGLVSFDCFSTVDFREYLKQAIVCYDTYHKEIIVSNPNHSYSYVYGVDSKSWYKISRVFSKFIHDYPDAYTPDVTSGTLLQINSEDHSDNQQFVVCTQPVKLGTKGFKIFERLVLNCWINQAAGKRFGFYMFGSQDGREWQFYDGIQPTGEFNDLVLTRSYSFKQAIILIAGEVDKDSYITGMEYSFAGKLQNKLR